MLMQHVLAHPPAPQLQPMGTTRLPFPPLHHLKSWLVQLLVACTLADKSCPICLCVRCFCSYMNSDAEHCGHPFCDRMVMSFQGGVYVTHAYSKTGGGLAASGVTTDVSGGEDVGYGCFDYTYDIPDQTGGSKVAAIVRRTRASGLLKVWAGLFH